MTPVFEAVQHRGQTKIALTAAAAACVGVRSARWGFNCHAHITHTETERPTVWDPILVPALHAFMNDSARAWRPLASAILPATTIAARMQVGTALAEVANQRLDPAQSPDTDCHGLRDVFAPLIEGDA